MGPCSEEEQATPGKGLGSRDRVWEARRQLLRWGGEGRGTQEWCRREEFKSPPPS